MLNKDIIKELTAFRKELHVHPEISENEKETAKRVVAYLKKSKPSEVITTVGGHGVLAIFDSKEQGDTIMFRADMDALPIQETNDFKHRSKNKGVSHKCGHDGHTTILLGLAEMLSKSPPKEGKAILLFQPAEEIGAGAAAVLQDEKFTSLQPDLVFGLHNLPGFPLNAVVVKNGSFTASVKSIVVKLRGKTAHAAEPEHGINPAAAIAELLSQVSYWSNNNPARDDFAVVTPIHVELGSIAFGTSAGEAVARFTIRSWTETHMNDLQQKIEVFLIALAKKNKLKLEYHYTEEFKANENDPEAVDAIRKASKNTGLTLYEKDHPFKWGEDFGLFTQNYKGAFFGIGAGEDIPALHNPDYDFPDELISTGSAIFYEICKNYLKCK